MSRQAPPSFQSRLASVDFEAKDSGYEGFCARVLEGLLFYLQDLIHQAKEIGYLAWGRDSQET
jgi:hypothetical protein